MSVHLIDLAAGPAVWVYDFTQEEYDQLPERTNLEAQLDEVGDSERELTLREALQLASAYTGDEFDNEVGQIVEALCVLRDRLVTPSAQPSIELLLDDRTEARELADNLAGVTDAVLAKSYGNADCDLDLQHIAGMRMQEWHERTWAPE